MNNNLLNLGQMIEDDDQSSTMMRSRFESSEYDYQSLIGQFSALTLKEDETQSVVLDHKNLLSHQKDITIEQCETFSTNSTCTASKKEEGKESAQFDLDSLSFELCDNNSS